MYRKPDACTENNMHVQKQDTCTENKMHVQKKDACTEIKVFVQKTRLTWLSLIMKYIYIYL